MEYKQLNSLIDLTLNMSNKGYTLFGGGDLSSDYQRISNELLLLKARLNKPNLYLLVGGEAKVGKSTFINCLIGNDICPSADVVCTNVPSIIRFGEKETAIVHYKVKEDGTTSPDKTIGLDEIVEYSTETKNSRNKEFVDYIEIFINSPILARGLVFIDTPGLGALDPQHAMATFDMATQADAILFLGNTDKELSSFEIESLKQLIECSKCGYVAHILTCCDQGDSDVIRKANETSLANNIEKLCIDTICISSTIYKKYMTNGNEAYLTKSGYKDVFTFINNIDIAQKDILCAICQHELMLKVEELRLRITTLKETAEDPIKLEVRLKELEACKNQLIKISDNSISWRSSFEKKQLELQTEISQFISDWQSKIDTEIDSLVENDLYLNNKEMLTSAIQAKLTVFKNELENKIQSRMLEIYLGIRTETGSSAIQETIHTPGFDISEMKLPKNCGNISKFNTVRNHFGSFMAGGIIAHGIGVTATALSIGIPAASAKIGAIVGSVAPGIGNLIGAAGGFILGGLIALTISIFQSKNSKRRKMAADCKKHIADFFNKVRNRVSTALTNNKLVLTTQFEQELKSQQKDCSTRIQKLQPMVVTARTHWNTVLDIYTTLTNLTNEFNKK